MTIYVLCLTSEMQEAANATRWADAHNARKVVTEGRRASSALSNTRANDVVVIVAHGSNTEIGTSGSRVTYTPATLATLLVTTMQMQNGVRVVLAACDSDQFAADLEDAIQGTHNLGNVTCEGQVGGFAFGADFRV